MADTTRQEKPLFTVITVCYQAADVIEETIRSVLDQTFPDFQYLIVDGQSTDGTCDVIGKYLSDERITFISEADKGLYDAMNKGIRMSKGAYLNFMNAGDRLADKDVLKDIADTIKRYPEMDFIYGNVLYRYEDGSESIRRYPQYCCKGWYQLLGDCINHQGLFSKRENYEEFDFAIDKYRISCYRDWITHHCSLKKRFKAVDRLICSFSFGGSSFTAMNYEEHLRELDSILKEYYPLGYPLYRLMSAIRRGKVSSRILHGLYEIVFLRGRENKG